MLTLAGFTSLEKLKTGTYTEMYRAIRTNNQQKVMLKFLRENSSGTSSIVKLQHEYFLLKQLSLPHIIRVQEFIQEQQTNSVLVLENSDGKFLDSYLNHQPLELNQFFPLALRLIDILGSLHQHHVTHKDIRPTNIIIHPDSLELTLVDLSVATQLEEEKHEGFSTSLYDTDLAYLSPEQTGRMNRPVDYRTDFYSLGIVFYEMLTGSLPFQASDPLELIHYHIAKIPTACKEKNSAIPEMLSNIVTKLMAKIPEERYASVTGLKADLTECAQQWKEKQVIEFFPLAAHDIHEHLTLSYKLYGRESELNKMSTIFSRVCKGKTEILLMSGPLGIGKTSLIQEIQKLIVHRQGYFIYGDFTHTQQNTPYSAIINAFQGLIKQLLTESEERLARVRKDLQNALGHVGQVIVDIIPALELIIGKQPPLPDLSATEAFNRFNTIFQSFVSVFTKPEHPLVICLDDLQWADSSSLNFIKNLLADSASHHLLIIGASPEGELDTHVLFHTILRQLQEAGVRRNTLTLSNLQQTDIVQLLVDTFGCDAEKVQEFAKILFSKTQGSPFYAKEFLKTLYREQLIFFNFERGKWEWNLARINQHGIADNVVDVQIEKIQTLASSTQKILKMAACIGFQFNLQTLATICQEPLATIATSLLEAIEHQLILPLGEAYEKTVLYTEVSEKAVIMEGNSIVFSFAHDRIQQIAYQSISENARREIHLKIGRILLSEQPLQENDKRLFTIMTHLHQGLPLIVDAKERIQLAQYNLWAGRKAKSTIAHAMAITHFSNGISLLPEEAWQVHHTLIFSLYREMIESEYAIEAVEDLEIHFKMLLQRATISEKAKLYADKSDFYSNKNSVLAIDNALLGLQLLGVKFPRKPSSLYVFSRILIVFYLLWRHSRRYPLSELPKQLPAAGSIERELTSKLVFSLMLPSFTTDPNLTGVAFCEAIIQTLRYGLSEYSWTGFEGFALILIGGFKQYKLASNLLEIAHKLNQQTFYRTGDARFLTCEGVLFNHWFHHGTQCLNYLRDAYQATLETGDLFFRSHIFGAYHSLSFYVSNTLSETVAISEEKFRQLNTEKSDLLNQIYIRCVGIKFLQDPPEGLSVFLENAQKDLLAERLAYPGQDITAAILATIMYVLGNYSAALQLIEPMSPNMAVKSTLYEIEFKTTLCLVLLAQDKKRFNALKRFFILQKIKSTIKLAATCRKQNAANFAHIHAFLLAELARSKEQYLTAMHFYNEAIEAAHESNFLRYIAMINERAGQMYLQLKQLQVAKTYLQNAYQAYQLWGANAKCKLLEHTYPDWFVKTPQVRETVETAKPHEGLDFMAIIKATQAISSEIDLEKLLGTLLSTVLQVAGAERIVLIAHQESKWAIQAEATADKQLISLFQAESLEQKANLPITLLQYVLRTKESLLVDDASKVERDLRVYDPYINRAHPKSLFILPIFYQGEMRYILYLENNLTTYAFTQQHTQSLQLLATQAAISLQNAYLFYQSTHDPLTGLANRNLLYQTFDLLAHEREKEKKRIAILFFDLDRFKQINDTLGHEVGDKMLVYIANQLRSCLRKGDLAIRLGGDEFVLMLGKIENVDQVKEITDQFRKRLFSTPLTLSGHELPISCSIGISLYPEDARDIVTLLKQADAALYLAKESGRDCYLFYSAAINQRFQQKKKLQAELQRAFEQNELLFHYQPIYDTKTRRIISLEALLRWQHPEKGILAAGEFIDLLKESNLVAQLDEWVLGKVCIQLKEWQNKNIPIVPIAINLCNFQFKFDSLGQRILNTLKKQEIDPRYLELELTETIFIADITTALKELKTLREQGIQVAIDDFGIGFSNLNYLKQLPLISKIKIDQSFVRDLKEDEASRAIILAMLTLAHHLKIQVIAEGVETEEQFRFLHQHGVDAIQGYFLQRPISVEKCEELLTGKIDKQGTGR